MGVRRGVLGGYALAFLFININCFITYKNKNKIVCTVLSENFDFDLPWLIFLLAPLYRNVKNAHYKLSDLDD